jgi:hypothetical protein
MLGIKILITANATFASYCESDQVVDDEMGGACGENM